MPDEVVNGFETAAVPDVNAGNTGEVEEQEQGESATSEANEGENEQQQEQKHKGGFQRRIDKLTREKADKERELEYWRNQALRTQKPAEEAKPKDDDPDKAPVKPQLEKFDTYDKYEEARDEYVEKLAEYKSRQVLKEAKRKESEESQKQQSQSRWEQAQKRGREAHDDFDDVVLNPDVQKHITPVMASAVMESDLNAELAYYLGSHPEEVRKLAAMSPVAQAKEIGKLEVRLAGNSKTTEDKPVLSRAPEPPAPTKRSTRADDGELRDDLDPDEWGRRFRKRLEAR